MLGSLRLQEWIHRLEMGAGVRYLRWLLVGVAFAMLALVYDSLCFRNFNNRGIIIFFGYTASLLSFQYSINCIMSQCIILQSTL